MPDGPLIEKARDLLQSGRIPNRRPDRILAGPGPGGAACPVCDEPIPVDQVVWEAEFDGPSGTTRHCFHVFCFRLIDLHLRREAGELDRRPR